MRAVATLLAASLLLMPAAPGHGQTAAATSALTISVTLRGSDGTAQPLPRHALLISDNPPTATPKRVVTAADGTVTVQLVPGNYTVESDRPLAFGGQQYEWRLEVDVAAGAAATLALTSDNADVGEVTAASAGAPPRAADATDVLLKWQDSVLGLWTPTAHASGFVIDASGVLATNQQAVGSATSVEVQLSPTLKVRAAVVVADRTNDVALLRVAPSAVAKLPPVPLDCAAPAVGLTNNQEVLTLSTPAGEHTRMTYGPVTRLAARAMIADLPLHDGSTGGPVFTIAGRAVGLTSAVQETDRVESDQVRVIRLDAVCEVVAAAATKLAATAAPEPTPLPIEPAVRIPEETLRAEAKTRAGSLNPYQVSSEGFDISFVTPVQAWSGVQGLMDFGNWHSYVAARPSVLLVRVTPKQAQRFWTRIARGAAMTQGIVLPPILHYRSGFARLRVLCGGKDVTPIHPFLLERRLSETDALFEGLYVFDPAAIGPHCGTVTMEAFADKTPATADPVTVDPRVIEQVWKDFTAYRALQP